MTPAMLDQSLYTVYDIKLLNPRPRHFSSFRIEITCNKKTMKPVKGTFEKDRVLWNEPIALPAGVTLESVIVFKILEKLARTKIVGEYEEGMASLLDMQKLSGTCQIVLDPKSKLELHFTIKESRVQDVLDKAIQPIEDTHLDEGEAWSMFLTYFEIVKGAADSVAQLNPYAEQAWKVLSAIPKMIQNQLTRNSNMNKLIRRLVSIYKYIADANQLPVLTTTQTDNLKLLIQQTLECAYFIREYVESSAGGKILKGASVDDKIQAFKETFDELLDAIQRSSILQTNIVTLRVSESVNEIMDLNLLDKLPYARNAGYAAGKKCLPGTRQKLIGEILEWVNKDTPQRVFVLNGHAGMGKSAVAHAIADIFRTQNRLGSLFCFNRNDKNRRNSLFTTISCDLADSDASWRQSLVRIIKETTIRESHYDLTTQFEELIIKPSKDAGTIGPVVIIIDALDESGDRTERGTILNLLFRRSSELPQNYRFIITSRPEPDIERQYQHANVFCKHMARIDPADALNDIQKFISSKLSAVAEDLENEETDWCMKLARKAQGLFQWANLACLYIEPTLEFELVERFRQVLSRSTSSLYEMYHQILDNQRECQLDSYYSQFKTIIGALVVSHEPLSGSALQAFFGSAINVKAVLHPLHSLFVGFDDSAAHIQPIHTSLFDFFLSPEQKQGTPNHYYINPSDQTSFTHACLRVMNIMLRFNICGLETSHSYNPEIPNFDTRVAEAVPSHLSYACCFWAFHLEYSRFDEELLKDIRYLMNVKLLYLFEVLGLLADVEHYGRVGMQILQNWCRDRDRELASQAADASLFGLEFGEVITESTPHLYLSALPFTPKDSFIYKQFISQYPEILSADAGQFLKPQCHIKYSFAKRHPSDNPSSLAFSPRYRQIATGFTNGEFWLWDYVTGKLSYEWEPRRRKNLNPVCRVLFSPDGELAYCCFKNGDILTWDARTNRVFYEPRIEGLPSGIYRRTIISVDGRYVAFVINNKYDHTVLLYDKKTQSKPIVEKCKIDSSILFSPDGRLFSFEGADRVTRLWDSRTRTFLSPSTTRTWNLEALTDHYIVALVHDSGTFVVWDIWANSIKLERPADRDGCQYFALFPNEKYLLQSHGNTCYVWDISTGEMIIKPFLVESPIRTIAVSPDSKNIALGMEDNTTRVLAWDTLLEEGTGSQDLDNLGEDGDAPKLESWRGRIDQAWWKGRYLLLRVWRAPHPSQQKRCFQVLDTTKMNSRFNIETGDAKIFAVSPEGDDHWSIVYQNHQGLCLWDSNTKEAFILDDSDRRITSLTFSDTGDRLIDGDDEGDVKIWDVRSRQVISVGGTASTSSNLERVSVNALTFSTDTTFLVAYATVIEEKECESRIILRTFETTIPSPTGIRSIAVTSNNTHIICQSETHLEIFDKATGASRCFDARYEDSRVSPNRKYVAWKPVRDEHKVEIWDVERGMMLGGFWSDDLDRVEIFEFSSDSTRISILHSPEEEEETCQHIDIWDVEARSKILRFSCEHLLVQTRLGSRPIVLHGDNLFLVYRSQTTDDEDIGRIWNLRVHRIMEPLYDSHLKNYRTQPGTMPINNLDTRRLIEDHRLSSEDAETLDYALAAWNKAIFPRLTWFTYNGWVLGPHGELLFWVPEKLRDGLWFPCMTYTTREEFIKLNFDKFVHGRRWTECRIQQEF